MDYSWFQPPFNPFIVIIFTLNLSLVSSALPFLHLIYKPEEPLAAGNPSIAALSLLPVISKMWERLMRAVRMSMCVSCNSILQSVWEQLPWPECVPVKTHLWIHTTYSLWSESRPAAISLPLPSLSLSVLKYSGHRRLAKAIHFNPLGFH